MHDYYENEPSHMYFNDTDDDDDRNPPASVVNEIEPAEGLR